MNSEALHAAIEGGISTSRQRGTVGDCALLGVVHGAPSFVYV